MKLNKYFLILASLLTLDSGAERVWPTDSLVLREIVTPATPAAGYNKLYMKSSSVLAFKDSAGVEHIVSEATKIGTTSTSTNASFYPLFVPSSSNSNQAVNLGTGLTFNPSSNTLTTTTFSGALSGNATTATSATTATNANNGATVSTSTNASFFPLFAASSSNGNQPFNLGTGLSFNPSTNVLTTTTFSGALSGNATTATTATNATNIAVTDDTTTNATMYPLWVTTTTGNLPAKLSSTKMNFNPSTGKLSATKHAAQTVDLNGSSSGTLTHSVPAAVTSHTLTWPAAQGAANTYLKNDGAGAMSWASAGGGGGDGNKLLNFGFEDTTNNWTASGGTLSTSTTAADVLELTAAGTWDSSSASQTLTSAAVTNGGLAGLPGEATCWIRVPSGTATHTMGIWDGSTLTQTKTITTVSGSTAYYPTTIGIIFGAAASTTAIRMTSVASNEPLIDIDNCFIGQNRNQGQLLQGTVLLGTAKITGCSGDFNYTTTGSFADPGTPPTGCSYATTGLALAPSTMLGAIKFASIPPGDITVEYEGQICSAGSATSTAYQFHDGTSAAKEESRIGSSGAQNVCVPVVKSTFSYTDAKSNITFALRAKVPAGTGYVSGTNSFPGVVRVYYTPSQSQLIARADTIGGVWSGYHDNDCLWNRTTTGSYGDPPADSTCTFTQRTNTNFGTVTSALSGSDKLPGVVFTPSKVTKYLVIATSQLYCAANANCGARLIDGSGNVLGFGGGISNSSTTNAVQNPMTLVGILDATDTTAKTVKIQGIADGTGVQIRQSIAGGSGTAVEWTIIPIGQAFTVPFAVGQINSNSLGMERIERVKFDGGSLTTNCTSNPCSISYQSGSWVSSVTRTATGRYSLNIAAGIFSGIPTCVATSDNSGSSIAVNSDNNNITPTSTLYAFRFNSDTGSAADGVGSVICMGPR